MTSEPTPSGPPADRDGGAADPSTGAARPIPLRRRYIALVAAGGVLGTALREALSLARPPVAGVPLTTAGINVVGAFVLGLLLQTLAGRGRDEGRRRSVRLFVGTGLLGGFTTYSALATDTVLLGDRPVVAVAYALGTVVLGVIAGAAGIAVGTRGGRR